MAFTKDPCAGARGGTDVTITLTAVYRRVADGNKDPRPKALGVFLDRHLSLTLGDKWKEAWKVDGPFCSRGNRRGKWIPLLLASGEGRGARNRGEGRGARGGPESGWPLPLHFEEKPLLEGQEEILRGPESPANPCHSLPSPDRGDRGPGHGLRLSLLRSWKGLMLSCRRFLGLTPPGYELSLFRSLGIC